MFVLRTCFKLSLLSSCFHTITRSGKRNRLQATSISAFTGRSTRAGTTSVDLRNRMLSAYLSQQKTRYLTDVQQGNGGKWTVVMGNEAGDLDSIASAIGFAYLTSLSKDNETLDIVPLIQTKRDDLKLRPENLWAFEQASLDPTNQDLLCLDDIPSMTTPNPIFPSHKFVLVDHNRLLHQFHPAGPTEPEVVAIIDHHADEQAYTSSSISPRIIGQSGSCASLVATYFWPHAWAKAPPELATLMLSAIFVDTGGLKAGGKAETVDMMAGDFLFPISTLAGSESTSGLAEELNERPTVRQMTESLFDRKANVGHLTGRDLLRRDYKEYVFTLSSSTSSSPIRIGLSTVPLDLKEWVPDSPTSLHSWMSERSLHAIAALTSFRRDKAGKKAKHKRQQLWILSEELPQSFEDALWKGLEASKVLILEEMGGWEGKMGFEKGSVRGKAYKQGNTKATRKAVAPLVKEIVEGWLATNASIQ